MATRPFRERWQFWKLRFSRVKDEVDKEVAEQAVCAMEKIEKSMMWLKRALDSSTAFELSICLLERFLCF